MVRARNLVQFATLLVLLYTGWKFFWFVRHFETGGASPFVARPALVEGFLPISALVALKNWIGNGVFDTIHPAGLVIFLAVLTTTVLLKKGFCSWFCPGGVLSERLGDLGRKLLGKNLTLPKPLDWALMAPKYLVLYFFAKSILIDMDMAGIAAFIDAPYNRAVDVKMLYFFTEMTVGLAAFIAAIMLLSALISNFWCRYLCPYGALLGLLSVVSPLRIVRDPDVCIDCQLCTRACPNRIGVATAVEVNSVECTSCLNCIKVCPKPAVLGLKVVGMKDYVSVWAYPALLLGIVILFFLAAIATGHWQTSVSYGEYMSLIPQAWRFSH